MARVALLTESDCLVRAFPGFTMLAASATPAPLPLLGCIDSARDRTGRPENSLAGKASLHSGRDRVPGRWHGPIALQHLIRRKRDN
jgi:hypothetical protein